MSSTSFSSTSSSSSTSTTTLPPPYIAYSYEDDINLTGETFDLYDNFDDNSLDAAKWLSTTDTGVTLAETGQQIKIDFAGVGSGSYGAIESVNFYNFIGSYVYCQVADAGNQGLEMDVVPIEVSLATENTNKVAWIISGNSLIANMSLESVDFTIRNTDVYDANIHKYFRIREQDGRIYWDLSKDKKTWRNYCDAPLASMYPMTSVVLRVVAGIWGTAGTTTVKFDDFNLASYVDNELNLMTIPNYENVSVDDGDYFIQYGSRYMLQQYKRMWTNNTDAPVFVWKGRSTISTIVSPMVFQIFNLSTNLWETLAVQNKIPADTDFTQRITQTSNISNYYDPTNTVAFRVYQLVV